MFCSIRNFCEAWIKQNKTVCDNLLLYPKIVKVSLLGNQIQMKVLYLFNAKTCNICLERMTQVERRLSLVLLMFHAATFIFSFLFLVNRIITSKRKTLSKVRLYIKIHFLTYSSIIHKTLTSNNINFHPLTSFGFTIKHELFIWLQIHIYMQSTAKCSQSKSEEIC